MKIKTLSILFLLPIVLACNSQDHTAWRNGTDGIFPASDLLGSWGSSGPEIIWSYEDLGQGHSSPAVYNEHIYTTGLKDGKGYLFKFDMKGNLVYEKNYGPEFTDSFFGPRGTPVIAGDKIYLISGYGHVRCLEESTGKEIWMIDMVNDLGGDVIRWGYNETPVINGDFLYCTPGGKNSVVALDRNTGKMIWSCQGEKELSAYCTPLLFEHNGRKILATHTESHLLGIDAKTGNLLWTYNHPNKWSVHANTPVYNNGGLYIFSGYGKGSAMLKLSADGSEIDRTWTNEIDSRMGGAVLIDGYLYTSGDNVREWRCIDWETGKNMWTEKDQLGKGVVIAADNKLYCYSDKGELAMVAADPNKFELLGKTRVTVGSEQHWAHPVIYNGVLYLRHGKALIAYKIK